MIRRMLLMIWFRSTGFCQGCFTCERGTLTVLSLTTIPDVDVNISRSNKNSCEAWCHWGLDRLKQNVLTGEGVAENGEGLRETWDYDPQQQCNDRQQRQCNLHVGNLSYASELRILDRGSEGGEMLTGNRPVDDDNDYVTWSGESWVVGLLNKFEVGYRHEICVALWMVGVLNRLWWDTAL